ncbi:ORF 73 ECLF1 [hydrothermal vent metagenome]|uniref:ORF 73 ECLF1 n=1 Tax=hydrothermal vent metagenome TaxID=652676 RepID=A0A1W1BPI5_9ZZZZ
MELPALKLPQVELPFDIATLLHPPVDHFVIAIPILVLIIEIINLFAKKKAIGVISFILLIIGMIAAIAAYFTGLHDGKEAFDALTQAGQTELKAHKLLGTYLMLASAIVVIFKLLSALIQRGLMKALYLLVLIVFIAGILKQGKDGGELVYEYGANVERVQDLDSDLFDANEELDDLKEKMKAASEKAQEKVEAVKETVSHAAQDAAAKTSQTVENVKEKAAEAVENVKKNTSAAVDSLKEKVSETTTAAEPAATEAAPAADTASAAEANTTAAQ